MIYEFINWIFPILSLLTILLENKNRVYFIIGLGATVVIARVLKLVFDVPRPEDALLVLESARFPSTHAAIVFYPLGYFLRDKRKWVVPLLLLLGISGSFSRIFLGVHIFVDIAVGGLIGLTVGILTKKIIVFIKNK